jgi:hypothetical protein
MESQQQPRHVILVHQCNCLTYSAKGIAELIFNACPLANQYAARRQQNALDHFPGHGDIITIGNGLEIGNLYAQFLPGKPIDKTHKKLDIRFYQKHYHHDQDKISTLRDCDTSTTRCYWFADGLKEICSKVEDKDAEIWITEYTGCRLAGGDWSVYEWIIGYEVADPRIKIVKYGDVVNLLRERSLLAK